MKRIAPTFFYICIPLLVSLFFYSCVKEDLDDCPDDSSPGKLLLSFEYLDPKGSPLDEEGYEIFSTRVQTIDILLYDAEEKLYQWLSCDEVIHSENRRKELIVEPGEYYVIGWANNLTHRNDFTTVFPEKTLSDSYIYHDRPETADPLHYAPDRRAVENRSLHGVGLEPVVIEPDNTTEHTVSFMSAHRTLNVYLRGFPEIETDDENPVVSVSQLASYYDNFLGRGAESARFTLRAASQHIFNSVLGDRELLGFATYYVPHFDNENNVTLHIDRPSLAIPQEPIVLKMTDILEKLEVEVEDGDDLVLNVLIELSSDGTYVQVKVPEWLVKGVDWK